MRIWKDKYKMYIIDQYNISSGGIPTDYTANYPFDGNANDESGNGYNLTVSGATLTLGKDGSSNSAYLFSTNTDTLSRVATDLPLGAQVSVCGWINHTTLDSFDRVFRLFGAGNSKYGLLWYQNVWAVQAYDASNNRKFWRFTSTPNSTWKFIMVEIDINTIRFFIDNVEQAPTVKDVDASVSFSSANFDIHIGNSQLGTNAINGKIDNFKIYPKILTSDEKTALYNE
jgi:hypothetical protein